MTGIAVARLPRKGRVMTDDAQWFAGIDWASQAHRVCLIGVEQACAARGWQIVKTFEDPGISGAKGRDQRPGFDALLKAVTRRQIDVVAAWSVDRLGRSLQDLVGFLGELNAAKCDLYLDKQAVDTTTPAGRALFQMLGVFAEFERSMIRERVQAGMDRAT